MGLFGVDANTTNQTLNNNQVTSQSGAALGMGATIGDSNIKGGVKVVAGRHSELNYSVTVNDPETARLAIGYSQATAIEALKANQELSNMAFSYANQQSEASFNALQNLGKGQQVLAAGGSGQDVVDAANSNLANTSKTWLIIAAVVAAGLFYAVTKIE